MPRSDRLRAALAVLVWLAVTPAGAEDGRDAAYRALLDRLTPPAGYVERELRRHRAEPVAAQAEALVRQGRRGEALAALRQAFAADPGALDLGWRALALAGEAGDPAVTRDLAEALLKAAPGFAPARLHRGLARQAQGDPAGAAEDFHVAVATGLLAPEDASFVAAARVDALIAAGRDRQALASLDEMPASAVPDPARHLRRARLLEQTGDLAAAETAFAAVSGMAPLGSAERGEAARGLIALLLRRGAVTEADEAARRAGADAGEPDAVDRALAGAAIATGRADLAEPRLRALLTRATPAGRTKAGEALADLLAASGRASEAAALFHEAAGAAAGRVEANRLRRRAGHAAMAAGRSGDAFEDFRAAWKDEPSPELLREVVASGLAAGRGAEVSALDAPGLDAGSRRLLLLAGLDTARKTGHPAETLAALSRLAERGLAGSRDRLDLAYALDAAGRSEEALAQYRAAWRAEFSATAAKALGLALQRAGRPDEAREMLVHALKAGKGALSPAGRAEVETALGAIAYSAGRYREAAARWGRAGSADPALALRRARALSAAGDSLAAGDALAKTAPDHLEAAADRADWFDLSASAAEARGRQAVAADYVVQAVDLVPTADRLLHLAALHRSLGRDGEATAALDRAATLAPDRYQVVEALAYDRLRHDRRDEAAALFEHALAVDPHPARIAEDVGHLAARRGDRRRALAAFAQAVDGHADTAAERGLDAVTAERDLYRLRRQSEILARDWTASAYATGCAGSGSCRRRSSAVGDGLNEAQGGAELAWRPPEIGYRDGRIFEVTARTFWNAGGGGFLPDRDSAQAGAGIRYKPLGGHDLYLHAERLIALGGRAENNWLARLTWGLASDLDVAPHEPALSPYYSLYADLGQYLARDRQAQGMLEARGGVKLRPAGRFFLAPFVSFDARDTVTHGRHDAVLDAGLGLSLHGWFGESAHRAAPGHLVVEPRLRQTLFDSSGGRDLRFTVTVHLLY
ncbi:MAG: hypothetical protein WCJ64_00010 [Rhodospirillaceae bacterium]